MLGEVFINLLTHINVWQLVPMLGTVRSGNNNVPAFVNIDTPGKEFGTINAMFCHWIR